MFFLHRFFCCCFEWRNYLIVVNISVHAVDILLVFVTFYNFLFLCLWREKNERKTIEKENKAVPGIMRLAVIKHGL